MNYNSTLITGLCAMAFSVMIISCEKEQLEPTAISCDSVNVPHESTHVIVEQTGTWCTSCGAEKDEIMAGVNHHLRVHHLSVHGGSDPFANEKTDDFRAAVIRSSYFPTVMGSTDPSFIDYLLEQPAKVQVALDVTKEGSALKINAKVEVVGAYDATKENGCGVFIDGEQVNVTDNKSLNLGIYLVEDNLVYPQANYGSFTHMNVMRDYLTEFAQGDELTDFGEEVSVGQSFCRTYEYDLNAHTFHEDVTNCKILAIVVEGNRCETSETEWYLNFLGSSVVELGGL